MGGVGGWGGGKEYARVLPQFLSESNIDAVCSNLRCPDVVTGLILTLLGIEPRSFPSGWEPKISHVAVDGYHGDSYFKKVMVPALPPCCMPACLLPPLSLSLSLLGGFGFGFGLRVKG